MMYIVSEGWIVGGREFMEDGFAIECETWEYFI